MQRDKLFDDGKAEPQSTVAARERGIRLAKPVEYVRQELLLDARARVLYRQFEMRGHPFDDHLYRAAFWGEFDCIGKDVPDDLLQTVGISEDDAASILKVCPQGDPFRFGAGTHDVNGGLEDRVDFDLPGDQFVSAGGDA